MITDTSKKILEFVNSKGRATTKEIVDYLGFSRQAIAKQLNKLLEQDKIYKIGRPPKVFYSIKKQEEEGKEYDVKEQAKKIIELRREKGGNPVKLIQTCIVVKRSQRLPTY